MAMSGAIAVEEGSSARVRSSELSQLAEVRRLLADQPFRKLLPDDARKVVGIAKEFGWFGSTSAKLNFAALLRDDQRAVARIIEPIPTPRPSTTISFDEPSAKRKSTTASRPTQVTYALRRHLHDLACACGRPAKILSFSNTWNSYTDRSGARRPMWRTPVQARCSSALA